MATTKKTQLFFEAIKASRGHYFVDYLPPGGNVRFASLTLVFHEGIDPADAKACMEAEAEVWITRYPVPVMVSAFDEKGDTVEISSSWKSNHLIAWKRSDGVMENRWELVKDEELPYDALSVDYLLKVYQDINYRTDKEVKAQADAKLQQRSRELRAGFVIIFIWAVIIPAGIAILGWANPLVGGIVTIYALGKAARQGALMLGWIKPSDREQEKRERDQRMRHYYYHCERNPAGFRRIVAENFEQDERTEIKKEAEELTMPSSATR